MTKHVSICKISKIQHVLKSLEKPCHDFFAQLHPDDRIVISVHYHFLKNQVFQETSVMNSYFMYHMFSQISFNNFFLLASSLCE